jgi:hypothetical protein
MNRMTLCQIVSWQIDLGNLIREIIIYFIITNVETRAISNLLRKRQVEFHQHGVNADRSPEFRDHNQIHFGLELKVR